MNALAKNEKVKFALIVMMAVFGLITYIISVRHTGFRKENFIFLVVVMVNFLVSYIGKAFVLAAFEYFLLGLCCYLSAFTTLDAAPPPGPENDYIRAGIGASVFIFCCWASSTLLKKNSIS